MPEGVGSEQKGIRPMLVIQNDIGNRYSPTVIGVPITSQNKKPLPTHLSITTSDCPGLKEDSTILFEQIVTFDKCRIVRYIGSISDTIRSQLYNKISISVGA